MVVWLCGPCGRRGGALGSSGSGVNGASGRGAALRRWGLVGSVPGSAAAQTAKCRVLFLFTACNNNAHTYSHARTRRHARTLTHMAGFSTTLTVTHTDSVFGYLLFRDRLGLGGHLGLDCLQVSRTHRTVVAFSWALNAHKHTMTRLYIPTRT